MKNTLIMAHRGASGYEPENTLASFRKAVELNADFIELDVQLTKDNKIVVIHDSTLDRTTNGKGKLENYDFSKLQKFRTKDKHLKIPLLYDVLKELKGKIKFNIEIKEKASALLVGQMVKDLNLDTETIISSDNVSCLIEIKKKWPELKTAMIYRTTKPEIYGKIIIGFMNLVPFLARKIIISKAKKIGCDFIHPHYSLASKKFIDFAHEKGFKINIWTVNKKKIMKKIKKVGVDGIITNYPDLEKQFI